MHGKKGLSPLIATVLLIGFAVALGVMIMSITQPLVTDSCDSINFVRAEFCKSDDFVYAVVPEGNTMKICRQAKIDLRNIDQCSVVARS